MTATELKPLNPNVTCSFTNICPVVYGPSVDTYCMRHNVNLKSCKLAEDIKDGQVDKFILNLVQRELNFDTIKIDADTDISDEAIRPVKCPRSLLSKATLIGKCSLSECPYNAVSLSYGCVLIHKEIFFSSENKIPSNLIELSKNIRQIDVDKFHQVSIYLSRLLIIMFKYRAEYRMNTSTFSFKNKKLVKLVRGRLFADICSTCYNPILEQGTCDCVSNKKLRLKRRAFAKKWVDVVKRQQERYDLTGVDTPRGMMRVITTNLTNIRNLRYFLSNLSIGNFNLTDVPFGYVLLTYNKLFKDRDFRVAENLGLSEVKYKIATELFYV